MRIFHKQIKESFVMKKKLSFLLLTFITLFCFQSLSIAQDPATAGVCYASTGQADGGNLIWIDPTTGVGTLIGPSGLTGVPGLAINSLGEIYGTESVSGDLYRIDATTGAATFVVAPGLMFLDGIAFDSNDVLYGIEYDAPDFTLTIIDPVTGATTPIGPTGDVYVGLAFDPTDGTLYGSAGGFGAVNPDAISTIDVSTGAATVLGTTGFGGATPDLHFDKLGNLYGAKGGGNNPNVLISVNKSNGAGTAIGDSIGFRSVSGLASFFPSGGGVSKLLLTEFVVTPTAGEFIEIFNPNASPVDLTNYFLSDVAFSGGPEYYYNVVQGLYGGTFGDFNSQFPNGATIGAGEYQIIALNGDADFFSTYGVNPTYEIDQAEFQSGTPDGIPDMLETHPGSIYAPDSTHNPGLTNGDEMIMLYYWDGMSDLVSDVDYVLYNSASPTPNDEAVDKTGVTIDGPDADTTGSTYLDDTPAASQLSALSPGSGFSTQRSDYSEGAQVMSGGNGVTGADETSEDMNNTWMVDVPTPFLAIPVELTGFSASVTGNAVALNWSTASELNNSGFDILRQIKNDQWQKIAFIVGSGTTTETRHYSFVDDDLAVGQYSYRLKQIDFDGTSELSDVVEVEILAPDVFALAQNYPNPFNPSTKINFSLAVDSRVTLTVFDVLGQEVITLINGNMIAGSHDVDFNAKSVNSGVYFYRIDATGNNGVNYSSVKKMILAK